MIDRFTEIQVLAAIPRLTAVRLSTFVDMQIVVPRREADHPLFGPIEVARLELLCDLADQFDLQEDALGIVMSLIDQLHSARRDFRALAAAVAAEPADARKRIAASFRQGRGVIDD